MAETNKDYILQVRNLKKYFPIEKTLFGKPITYLKAVDDVSFDVEAYVYHLHMFQLNSYHNDMERKWLWKNNIRTYNFKTI